MDTLTARASSNVAARLASSCGPSSNCTGSARRVKASGPKTGSRKGLALNATNNFAGDRSVFNRATLSKCATQTRNLSIQCATDVAVSDVVGTPVKNTSVLVVGATGTLGRQIVRRALDEGYDVRCIVRPRQNPADFLRDWGAQTVRADLLKPETLPPALVGIHTIIDASTARPEESIGDIDWEGKKALIQSAKAMGIQRYVFFSIEGCEKHMEVPLMEIKRCTELYLEEIGMPYTTLRCCGFMQALIGQYAVPILEEQEVWGTNDTTKTAYLDTQDVARMTLAALNTEKTIGKTLSLAGPQAYTIQEVISKCEKKASQEANVKTVPIMALKSLRGAAGLFQWSKEAGDRLAFSELMGKNLTIDAPMDETYEILGIEPSEITTLDEYLDDFYGRILKKLKEVGGQSRQKDFYL
mmetsp:Transcript_38449/g.46386  ORF Transcript_38449/g.46386 Transcript_38449/m.46386 type:complete len:413 (-) Transcript_38449:185-1423(-)|eukprot:CAMPEP_0197857424 /NCGR_PEP_ID=MMETSP1438-20131217/30465_1 /TAXON_ID=1461541 /ORGANISM="Pterosperma sp., Strain CCMP1384" /LENGTH=412 /DNA_ID=CAMNT_0043473247 /DNA_START=63 /DNA_END=1301 /DNA_ORIENTATION=+